VSITGSIDHQFEVSERLKLFVTGGQIHSELNKCSVMRVFIKGYFPYDETQGLERIPFELVSRPLPPTDAAKGGLPPVAS